MPLDLADLAALYRYNSWANDHVLDAASAVNETDFVRNLGNSYGSIHETLTHILWAEWIWLERWKGQSPRVVFSPRDFPGIRDLRERFHAVAAERAAWLQRLPQGRLSEVAEYVNLQGEIWRYPLWQQLLHVLNHSTYHRGQVTTLLRQVGATPAITDFLVYYDEGGS